MRVPFGIRRLLFSIFLCVSSAAVPAQETAQLPRNLGSGLDKLVAWHLANAKSVPSTQRRARMAADQPLARSAQVDDAADFAIVDVRLDGTRTTAQVRATLTTLGCRILGTYDIGRAGSIVSVKLPLARALQAAQSPGVLSLSLVHRPWRRVGRTTSQGAAVVKSPALNTLGLLGAGITVGVISDSFDVTQPNAAADIASGDLPGPGNAAYPTPVYVLSEGDPVSDQDEGRAMLQIVHDMAPAAKLAFATCGPTQAAFAENIRALRTDPNVLADVIVDDIAFPGEPFFSDGPIAQAVDDVVTSTTLAGKPVAYFTSAGNDGTVGMDDVFRPISDADARKRRPRHNLRLQKVPAELTAGGFHNFGTATAPVIAQKVTVTGDYAVLNFQWDDAFIPDPTNATPNWISTDYNLLVFSAAGAYLGTLSGTDDNFATGQALEFAVLTPAARGRAKTYQIAIARRAGGTQEATRLRYVTYALGRVAMSPFQRDVPTIFGHAGSRHGDAVAAYHYDDLHTPAEFNSTGPVEICFDQNGTRLAQPEVRQQPTIAAPDAVNTTFFPSYFGADTDGDGFPNFPGTSAAAPHAAAVAALLIEAKGGPGSLTAAQIRAALQGSAAAHDLDPYFCRAVVPSTDLLSTVTLEAHGDDSDASSADKQFFKLTFTGPAARRLTRVTIDLTPTPLVFDPRASLGLPFRVGAVNVIRKGNVAGSATGRPRKLLTVKLRGNRFASGASVEFGIDRDLASISAGGNSADLLEGAIVTATTVEDRVTTQSSGTFSNVRGTGYSARDGFGLIDAEAALGLLP